MLTATLRGMFAHKLRLVLTTASIALGVAFLAGTLVLTDTMRLGLRPALRQGVRRHRRRRAHRGRPTPSRTASAPAAARSRPASSTDVRAVDGVRAAEGASPATPCSPTTTARPSSPSGGAPTMGYSLPPTSGLRGDVRAALRHGAGRPDQVAIDATSAEEHHIAIGSTIKVLFQRSDAASSPSSAPSASVARRTSAAPRRRTSTPRPRSSVLGDARLLRRDRRAAPPTA